MNSRFLLRIDVGTCALAIVVTVLLIFILKVITVPIALIDPYLDRSLKYVDKWGLQEGINRINDGKEYRPQPIRDAIAAKIQNDIAEQKKKIESNDKLSSSVLLYHKEKRRAIMKIRELTRRPIK